MDSALKELNNVFKDGAINISPAEQKQIRQLRFFHVNSLTMSRDAGKLSPVHVSDADSQLIRGVGTVGRDHAQHD
jgi:hypothetical protein